MSFFKKMRVVPLSALIFSHSALAVVCTDATGNALQLEEMASSAGRWIEEKGMWAAELAQEHALTLYENVKAEINAANEITAVTTSISSTANAHATERYLTSPSACSTMRGAKALLDSLSNSNCKDDEYKSVAKHLAQRIRDCQNGTGLHCDDMGRRREAITSRIVKAVEDQDGETLMGMLDGAVVLGVGDEIMHPDDAQKNEDALALLLGVSDTETLPRTINGSLPTANDPAAIARTTEWAVDRTLESIPNAALLHVNGLYKPQDGKQSIIAQLEERVKYYNSEEFIKLITNTNDKSSLPSDWDTMHPDAKHMYLQSLPIERKIVSSEQVIRMQAEMQSLSLMLQFMTAESSLTNTSLIALQNKIMLR